MAADFAKQVKFAKIKNDTDALFRLFSPLDVDDALYEAVVADAVSLLSPPRGTSGGLCSLTQVLLPD